MSVTLSKPDTKVTFLSARRDLELVKKPEIKRSGPEGQTIETIPGERVVFQGVVLRVPPTGFVTGKRGEKIPGKELIPWLENHPLAGDREEGFWRHEEPAPEPTEDELTQLQVLAINSDTKGLEELIALEEKGWGREKIIGSARRSLEMIQSKAADGKG